MNAFNSISYLLLALFCRKVVRAPTSRFMLLACCCCTAVKFSMGLLMYCRCLSIPAMEDLISSLSSSFSSDLVKRKTSIHAETWWVNIKIPADWTIQLRVISGSNAWHWQLRKRCLLFFFDFFKICLLHPYTSVSLKFLQNFRNFRNLWNTGRIRKRCVMTDFSVKQTQIWSKFP